MSAPEPRLHAGAGGAELREDAPLKAAGAAGGAAWGAGGPRLIVACFAALSAAITLALFTQIHYGDYEVVPHGGAASDAAECSAAGTRALKAGGRALDAAAAAALCLAVLAPHRTSLHASGSLLYWEYRRARSQGPLLAEWGPAGEGAGAGGRGRPPRLLAALATLHARHGALPWADVLQPAIDLAKNGFQVSESLAAAEAAAGAAGGAAGSLRTAPALAALLQPLQRNTSAGTSRPSSRAPPRAATVACVSAELAAAWPAAVRASPAAASAAGSWRLYVGGAGAAAVRRALAAALQPAPRDPDEAQRRVLASLQGDAERAAVRGATATGLAVVDSLDTYVAAVTGLPAAGGAVDLAPALLVEGAVCGARYVAGGGSSAALAQALGALAAGGGARAVERARAVPLADGSLAAEAGVAAGALPAGARLATAAARSQPVNVVQQRGDALLTHADSRGGGLASRF